MEARALQGWPGRVRTLGASLLLCVVAGAAGAQAEPRCLDTARVCLDVREDAHSISFYVSNQEAGPFSARVLVSERSNLVARTPLPFRAVVAAGEEKLVGVLEIQDPAQNNRYVLHWNAASGDVLARHDASVRYRMPFGGDEPRRVSQGVAGRDSHRGRASYSIDFAMPWGSPVVAARAGRVVAVVDGHASGGVRKLRYDQSNRVDVLHADGTLATYAHLRQDIPVQVGRELGAGDPIGFSGDSGEVGGPHLHFMVWKREADLSWSSLPVRFGDGSPAGFVPAVGVAYAPGCASGDPSCAESARPARAAEPLPARRDEPRARIVKLADGSCMCPNGAIIRVELACEQVCGR